MVWHKKGKLFFTLFLFVRELDGRCYIDAEARYKLQIWIAMSLKSRELELGQVQFNTAHSKIRICISIKIRTHIIVAALLLLISIASGLWMYLSIH